MTEPYIRPNPGGSFNPLLDGYPECSLCLSKDETCHTQDKTKIQLCWLKIVTLWNEEALELDYQWYREMKEKRRHSDYERTEIDKLYRENILANAHKLKDNPMFFHVVPPNFDD